MLQSAELSLYSMSSLISSCRLLYHLSELGKKAWTTDVSHIDVLFFSLPGMTQLMMRKPPSVVGVTKVEVCNNASDIYIFEGLIGFDLV